LLFLGHNVQGFNNIASVAYSSDRQTFVMMAPSFQSQLKARGYFCSFELSFRTNFELLLFSVISNITLPC